MLGCSWIMNYSDKKWFIYICFYIDKFQKEEKNKNYKKLFEIFFCQTENKLSHVKNEFYLEYR